MKNIKIEVIRFNFFIRNFLHGQLDVYFENLQEVCNRQQKLCSKLNFFLCQKQKWRSFFLGHTPIFIQTIPFEPAFQPAIFESIFWNRGCANIRLGTEDGKFHLILMKNGSAALSLINKVCSSILYIKQSTAQKLRIRNTIYIQQTTAKCDHSRRVPDQLPRCTIKLHWFPTFKVLDLPTSFWMNFCFLSYFKRIVSQDEYWMRFTEQFLELVSVFKEANNF